MTRSILHIEGLEKHYTVKGGIFRKDVGVVYAVDGISLDVDRGDTLGLVGESGCGKTTLALTTLRLIDPTAGEVRYEGQNIFELKGSELRRLRGDMQIIFQDPFSSLNPRMTVYQLIGEVYDHFHLVKSNKEKKERISDILAKVGLSYSKHVYRYPHEFSGGQRQRIAIARALAVKPRLLIADEPVSGLDVSIRSQILNLLQDLHKEFKLTTMFVSHDLSVVKYFCNRVAVMYVGKFVELAKTNDLFHNPLHPYTQALISAIPTINPSERRARIVLSGDVPTPINPPTGCRFHPRCRYAKAICTQEVPELKPIDSSNQHLVACHFAK
jgi:oligopeptide transport system ATP-binding protein